MLFIPIGIEGCFVGLFYKSDMVFMKISVKHLATYLAIVTAMLYLALRANVVSPDEGFPIRLNVFGLVTALIALVFYQYRQVVLDIPDEESSNLTVEAKQASTFIYAMGVTGVLFIFSIFVYFFVPVVYQSLPQMVSGINVYYLFLSALLLFLFYYGIGVISSSLMIVRYLPIFLLGLAGLLVGNALSYSAALYVSLLLGATSKVGLLDTLLSIFVFSILFGLGVAGIPSGVIGLVSGFIVGVLMYRVRENLSDDKAVTIGFLVSLTITILVFLILVMITDAADPWWILLVTLFFGTVYVLANCVISMLIYRKYFRVVSEVIKEQ